MNLLNTGLIIAGIALSVYNVDKNENQNVYYDKFENLKKIDKNGVKNTEDVLRVTLNPGDNIPVLDGNPNSYTSIVVTTTGNKQLDATDFTNLKNSEIPKIDLSNAEADVIPAAAFNNASFLTEFKFPKELKTIEGGSTYKDGAFYKCVGLTGDLVIPDTVTSIGGHAFSGCKGFNGTLTIPESVTSIDANAFYNCTGLTGNLIIPEGIATIKSNTFAQCTGFTGDLIIPNSVVSIEMGAFSSCFGFNGKLILGNSIEIIGQNAFASCKNLKGDIIIPDSVIDIGINAFYGDGGFDGKLVIGSSVVTIQQNAFINCTGLTGDILIPDSVTSIGSSAFNKCSGFTSLKLGNSLSSIGANAFAGCTGLVGSFSIPNSLTTINANSFNNCTGIEKVFVGIDSSDADTNYKESLIDTLSSTFEIELDIPCGFDINNTWIGQSDIKIHRPILKDIVDGVEQELIDNTGEAISLEIKVPYDVDGIVVLKDDLDYILPPKNKDNKHIFTRNGTYNVTITTNTGIVSTLEFAVVGSKFENIEQALDNLEINSDFNDIEDVRQLINSLPESAIKDLLQDRLNSIFPKFETTSNTASSNADIYIVMKNTISLSLDTNSIIFDDFTGVEDIEKRGAINLTVESSLPYNIVASLEGEIQNSDGSVQADKSVLGIKSNTASSYNTFTSVGDKVTLLDNQRAGSINNHPIDLKLNKNIIPKADVYKATIKFEAIQQ